MVRKEGVPLLDLGVRRPQYFREGFRDSIKAGEPSMAADDAGKGLYGVCRVHSGSERVGNNLGHAVENGGPATAGFAEAYEDLEGAAVGVGGDGDVDLAAMGWHFVGGAG